MVRLIGIVTLVLAPVAAAQQPNYDEAKVPAFELPDPLAGTDGARIDDAAAWPARRAALLRLFEDHVYGRMPTQHVPVRAEVVDEDAHALDGRATRRQLVVRIGASEEALAVDLLVFTPNADGPHPTFLALNFKGNHTVHADPAIRVPTSWVPDDAAFDVEDHRASTAARGKRGQRWPIERIVERGYGLATAYYGDLDPDFDDGFLNGLHALVDTGPRDEQSWGAIGAWAFGMSRLLDALAEIRGVDTGRVAALGHSRLGKTALWAGATDARFWLVVSNDSGCGGAALSRRRFGETVDAITGRFPHWFCGRFREYAGAEDELPVDQHELIALIAPRPVYVASAAGDRWADPRGEFLAARAAEPVFRLFGLRGIGSHEFPEPDTAFVDGAIGYHLRSGPHDLRAWDWDRFMDFADRHGGRDD